MDDHQPGNTSSASQQSPAASFLHGTTSTLQKASAAAVNSIHHLPHLTYFGRSRSCSRSSHSPNADTSSSSSPPSKVAVVSEEAVFNATESAVSKTATTKSMVAVSDEHVEAENEREADAFPAVALHDVVSPTIAEQEGASSASPPKPSYYEALEKKRARGRSLMDAASLLP